MYQQYNYKQDDTANLLFIKACGNSGNYDKCVALIDGKVNVNNLNKYSIQFITTLIDFYGRKGDINIALNVFNKMDCTKRNGNIGEYSKCEKIINDISDLNNCSLEFVNTLIDYYGRIGNINNALKLFENVPENRKDNVLINTMMSCFIDNDKSYKAILLYKKI